MKRNLIIAAAVAVLACGPVRAAQAEDGHVGLFKNVAGQVHVLRAGTTLPATAGMTLFVADRLVSERGASAGIVFKDGTLLTLGSAAQLDVRDYVFDPKESHYAFSLYLAKGQAIYSSGRIGKLSPESVKVDTPTATVGVRGTRFIIDAR